MVKILNINHIWWKTGSFQLLDTISKWMWNNYQFHNLFWYCFWNVENSTSLYKTNNSKLYRNCRYKLAVGFNLLFDWLTPWHIDLKFLHNYKPYVETDIIHIHSVLWWFFDWNILPEISKEKKVIMTFHDDWIVSWNDKNNLFPYKTKKQYEKRKNIFQNSNISFVWVSNRITNKIKDDWIVWTNNITTIYNWINPNIFHKKNKIISKKELWLSLNKKIILSVAWAWKKSSLKWIQYVEKLHKEYKDRQDLLFISLGNDKNKIISKNFIEIGFLSSKDMSKYFSSADLFLYPTLMDSFWLVVAESFACWCPIVTFETWWVPEIVHHKKNWYIAKYRDYEDLKEWFNWTLNNLNNLDVELSNRFYQENMINEYKKLYNDLLK